jgi:hypothetical protein
MDLQNDWRATNSIITSGCKEKLGSHQADFCEILFSGFLLQSVYLIQVWLKMDKSNKHFALEPTYIYDVWSYMRNTGKTVHSLKYITVLDGCDFYAK